METNNIYLKCFITSVSSILLENVFLVSEVNRIKFDIFTNTLFEVHLILLFNYLHSESVNSFFCAYLTNCYVSLTSKS